MGAVKHITGRSGKAHLAPMAAGKAQPREPAQRRNICSGVFESTMVPVQMPEWPVSVTSTPLEGIHSVISLHSRSGRIGEASELTWGATDSRQSRTNSWARATHSERGPSGSMASINLRSEARSSP